MDTRIINETVRFVQWLYAKFLPVGYRDFQLELSLEFKNKSLLAGRKANLNEHELEVLALSALLYNAGCIEGQYHNRAVSKTIAQNFLKEHDVPDTEINEVIGCIEATEAEVRPRNRMEELIQFVQKATPSTWFKKLN